MNNPVTNENKTLWSLLIGALVLGAVYDMFHIAQGTGEWYFGFSQAWAWGFVFYAVFLGTYTAAILVVIWNRKLYRKVTEWLLILRPKLQWFRWGFVPLLFLLPVYLFQFTELGIVFHSPFTRLLIWQICLLVAVFLLAENDSLGEWNTLLALIVLMGGTFAVAAALRYVSDYPFAQGWSEGNRLWDYSIMFGRERYIYPAEKIIPVALDKGRQFIGGLPFLISGVRIEHVRLWLGLTSVIPYLLIGLALFRTLGKKPIIYLVLSVWAYLFLNQGPIHTPLILSAFLVLLAWRSPVWISAFLLLAASYIAGVSRFTWSFAPMMWLFMLELSDIFKTWDEKHFTRLFPRLGLFLLFGLIGGIVLPPFIDTPALSLTETQEALFNSPVMPENVGERVASQPLLWYRLFPNPTYGPGILLGLFFAVGPSAILLMVALRIKAWKTPAWQSPLLTAALMAFFFVGIIISTKIGGGGDLHNMDMFLIGVLLTVAVAWFQGIADWVLNSSSLHWVLKTLLVLSVLVPALKPLQEMRGFGFWENAARLTVLSDAPREQTLDLTPSAEIVDSSLRMIQNEVEMAKQKGDVLFIDQRQLLTFGYVNGLPLIPEYDKKLLIERAFSGHRDYFTNFYADLKKGRFALIIVQPLGTKTKGNNDHFGEENDTWVKWVSRPLLCYYEVKRTLIDVNVQLLIPKQPEQNCMKQLP